MSSAVIPTDMCHTTSDCSLLQAIMTLKGMRKADQQVILDTLGMDRVGGTTATTTATTATTPVAPLTAGLESGLGLTNTRWGWSPRHIRNTRQHFVLVSVVSSELEHLEPSLSSGVVSTT